MAALTLRGSTSPGEAIGQFSGTNRHVADFFMREVVGRQPTRVQRFLMRTAILDRFTARLCDQVTQIPGCAEVIARLDRDSVFLVPLDDQRMWYRYHHLFAETLRGQLARAEPGLERVLHERASAWHREHGSAEAAMEHALATGDIPGATSVIARHWYTLASAGRVNAVRTQLAVLGEDHIAGDPAAAHSAAWTAALSGDHATARRWLKVVETAEHEGPLPDGTPSLEFSAALLRGSFGFDGLRVMRESASAAVAMETNSRSPWHTLARTVLGASLYLTGDIGAAGTALDEALLNAPAAALTRLLALGIGARVAAEQGRLTQAARRAGLARQVMEEAGLTATAQSSQVWMAAGEIHARQGRLDEARSEFEQALRARQLWPGGGPWPNVEIRLSLARVLTDMGDRPLAVAHLAQARAALALLPDGTEALQARLGQLQRRLAGTPPGPLAEPLTSREEAILRLLGGTRSLREIGQELFLSRNTIKTHTRNIYRKLGATTREDAVQRAREHGICQ
jgi:LuxR family maltose regulon positive regulatory protein